MFFPSKSHGAFLARHLLLGTLFIARTLNATAVGIVPDDTAQWLRQADDVKTLDHAEFVQLLQRLGDTVSTLTNKQKDHLRYLKAWEIAYVGDEEAAIPLLNAVIVESSDNTLRFRAGVLVVNILANRSRYEEAFNQLSQLLGRLPQITDNDARAQSFGVAAFLYEEAGQYDLASNYADRLAKENPSNREYLCKAKYTKLVALYKSGKINVVDRQFPEGIDVCVMAGDKIFANGIRSHMADLYIQNGQLDSAIKLLKNNYSDVLNSGYSPVISHFDASMAQAYWDKNDILLASQFAQSAVGASGKNAFDESLIRAYKILYLFERKTGDMPTALAYHEKYMAADKGYLNEVSAKSLAYETVKQQVLAKKLQIETLNKQNQILELKQALGKKALQTNQLQIILLLTILAFIAFWAFRVKRSQLRFMGLARRDGLTGIFNRQHFVASAEQQLKYCQKLSRVAGLIVIDLDNFKIVNDTHGHAVGDHILRRAVAACEAHLRSTDVFGRLGGEEFGILMPECNRDMVAGRAELIRLAIESVSDSEDARGVLVSASFGVSSTAESGYNLRQMLIHADKALYGAKRDGRNRVVVFEDAESSVVDTDLPLQRR